MNSSFKSLLVGLVVASASFAAPEGEVVIRTRDGKSHQGRVLSETQKGYLFSTATGTSVIEFAAIVDLQQVVATQPIAPPPPVAPASTPARLPAPSSFVEAKAEQPTVINREGFHFGIGVQTGIQSLGVSPVALAQAHFDFNFGGPAYRLNANFGVAGSLLAASVDNLFHYNFGKYFALGAGVRLGGDFMSGVSIVYIAPLVQPAIVKLGERGQHQISLTGTAVVFSLETLIETGPIFSASLGYSYLF